MLPLEIKQTGGKLLPHSVLRGGGVFPEEVSRSFQKRTGQLLKKDSAPWRKESALYFLNKIVASYYQRKEAYLNCVTDMKDTKYL
jgi:hypothetical protein